MTAAAFWKVLVLVVLVTAPLAGCVERATLDVLHVDDVTFTFTEPRTLDVTFTVYQFQGSRSAVVTGIQLGAIMRQSVENATDDPLHTSQHVDAPDPLTKGDSRRVTHTFTLPEPADDPDYYGIYSGGILVKYRLEGAGGGGEVVYSTPCYTRSNELVNTTGILCREVYSYTRHDDEPPLPGDPEWQERLDACCRDGDAETNADA